MDVARNLARGGVAEGMVVLTEEQTGGRGRLGRSWAAPRGNLALSLVLRPSLEQLPSLIMMTSTAVVHSVEEVTGLKTEIKWPNDVLFRGKKICGILIENESHRNVLDFAIIGVGINVNLDTSIYPEIAATATSLSSELGREVSPMALLQSLLEEIERLYVAAQAGESVYEEWCRHLETVGKQVRLKFDKSVEEGYAESVGRDGSLLLRHHDGSSVQIVAGEVTPADYNPPPSTPSSGCSA